MRPFSTSWVKWVCAGMLLAAPFTTFSVVQAESPLAPKQTVMEQISQLPPKAKQLVEDAVEFFSMEDIPVNVQITSEGGDTWQIHIDLKSDEYSRKTTPQAVYMNLSKGGKLEQLDLAWKDEGKDSTLDKNQALRAAADFAEEVLGGTMAAGKDTNSHASRVVKVPLYPIVNGITVEDEVAYVMINSSGQIRSFRWVDHAINIDRLPSASGIIALEQAKRAFADQLALELVLDDENGVLQYAASPYRGIDAKTGEAIALTYHYSDELLTLKEDKEPSSLTVEKVKKLSSTYAGLQEAGLKVSTSRTVHPDEAATTSYTATDGASTITLFLDEKTGELLSIQTDEREEPTLPRFTTTRTEAKKRALQFLEDFVHMKKGEYLLRERYLNEDNRRSDDTVGYQLDVFPIHNGVRAAKPILSMEFEREDNVLSKFTARSFEWHLAATAAVVAKEAAKEKWLEAMPIELHYIFPEVDSPKAEQAKLVFVPAFHAESRSMNAASGEWLETSDW